MHNIFSFDGAISEGNKPLKLKGDNQKFRRGSDGVGFQPTIPHHNVFHVSMERSRKWPLYRHHIAEHTSSCARSPRTSHLRGVPASASSQPSHTITCSMFPWDDRGDGHPSDTTLLNTLAPVLVAHGLLTHGTTKLPLPVTKRTKN
ncbi:hypothetical protein PoB_005419700 [Plakobranchus ocellatus]|uniref:Uncharacterized protein n=1 Tax=Plakobranchus ocellatus TaxID=259542 RepID=A0AAV4C8T3_9GAST|nr:hypothetical protein PoB_005419700 [Plakobranchus ocellatus]